MKNAKVPKRKNLCVKISNIVVLVCVSFLSCSGADQSLTDECRSNATSIPLYVCIPAPILTKVFGYMLGDPITHFAQGRTLQIVNKEWYALVNKAIQTMSLEEMQGIYETHKTEQYEPAFLFFKWAALHEVPHFIQHVYNKNDGKKQFFLGVRKALLLHEQHNEAYQKFVSAESNKSLDVTKGSMLPFLLTTCAPKEWINTLFDLEIGPKTVRTSLLHIANNPVSLTLLINHGADVNLKNGTKTTPLHDAAMSGNVPKIDTLLDHNAHINSVDVWDHTPLSTACHYNRKDAVQTLLDYGASINNPYYAPLNYLLQVAAGKGYAELTQLLLDRGADKDCCISSIGETPLDVAICAMKWLISANDRAPFIATIKTLLHYKANPNIQNSIGNTPLHAAVAIVPIASAQHVIELLLLHGADLDKPNNHGQKPYDLIYNNPSLRHLLMQK